MRVLLYVFSGTGNARRIAQLYKNEFFLADSAEVDIYYLGKDSVNDLGEGDSAPSPTDYDVVGFGYPIHAFNAPEIVIRFAKNLPAFAANTAKSAKAAKTSKNSKAVQAAQPAPKQFFVFKTGGEPLWLNDCSSQKLIKILRKKGYEFLSEHHYIMPYNIIYRHSDTLASLMHYYAERLVEINTQTVLKRQIQKWRQPFFKTFYMPIMRIEWSFARFNGKRFKIDSKKCLDCGLCIKNCPMKNITKTEDGYCFGNACAMCMGCSFGCPASAIKIGWLNGWKVNGEYKVKRLEREAAADFRNQKIGKMYKKYFAKTQKFIERGEKNGD